MARIGYIVNAFPVVSETFVLNELRAVEGKGLEIAVFSLDGPGGGPLHGGVGELRAPIVRAPRGFGAWIAHLRFAVSHSGPYARIAMESRHEIRGPAPDTGRRLRRYFQRFHRSVWIAEAALRLDVAHIHAHYAKEPLEIAERVRRIAGIPYSFTAHAKDLYTSPRKRLARRLRSATFALTCHKAGYEELREIGGVADGGKVMQVAHGIDTDLFHARRCRPEGNLILAVGRLTPKKGLEHLVRACAVLHDRGRDFRCEIIGEGRMRGPLRREIEAHGLFEHVRIRRFVAHEELRRWYNRASVVASPAVVTDDGNRDGLQNVILEAMACGVAVVGTDVGGIPEAIDHDRTGLLVPSGDVTALADAIDSLLADPDQAERLGRAAAELMAKLDFRQTNLPLVERFREALAPAVEVRLREVEELAWRKGGLADRAAEALGIAPVHRPDIEDALRQRILPGLRANAWRPDLDRIVNRRMWDELFKARNVRKLERMFGGALPIGSVLDLGCGRGGLSVALRALGHDSIGIDFRARNCQVTRFRAQRYAIEVPTCAAQGEQLPLADGSFGLVCCLEVLEHVQDPVALLKEMRRVLAPGGACAVTIVNRLAHRDPHYHLWGVNFLPRRLGMRYAAWRDRAKTSSGDRQTLDDMHYYYYPEFLALARSLGFEVEDPEEPREGIARSVHRLKRACSLGFNDALLLLRRTREGSGAATEPVVIRT